MVNVRPDYGACFAFNHPKLKRDLKILDTGVTEGEDRISNYVFLSWCVEAIHNLTLYSGLSIDFNVNQAEYVPLALASGAGVRITITHPSAAFSVRPKDHGYHVKPHTMTDFAIRMKQTARLPEPYTSKCWNDWSDSVFTPEDRVKDAVMFKKNKLQDIQSDATQAYSYSVMSNIYCSAPSMCLL